MSDFSFFRKYKKLIINSLLMLLMAGFFVSLYFFNRNIYITPLYDSEGTDFEKARVVEIIKDNLQKDGSRVGGQVVNVEMLTGPYTGQVFEANSLDSYLYGAACQVGTRVIVQTSVFEEQVSVSVYNYDRSPVLYLMIAVVVFFLWLIGGTKGVKSACALAFSLICIIFLYLPMIYIGY